MKKEVVSEVKTEYCYPSLESIEKERQSFLSIYRKNNTLKTIVTMIAFAIVIVAFIIIPKVFENNGTLQSGLTILIAVFGLGGVFVYSFLTRKKLDKRMKEYFAAFYKNINEFSLNDNGCENTKYEQPGKIELSQFTDCGLYKDIFEVGSRGFTEFEYNKIPVAVCDCAGNIKGQKRVYPVFVGKYLFAPCSAKNEAPIVIYLKGNEKSLPPTNVDDIAIVEEDEKMVVRSNDAKWKSVFTPKFREALNEINTGALLVDLAICIKDGRLFVLMGYDDPLMVVPLMETFNSKPYEQYKSDLAKVLKLIEVLNK